MHFNNKHLSSLVSIIIPTHNYGFSIKETLLNVQAQEYSNWEVIVIDDGSTDNTRDIVKQFVETDRRYNYYYQEKKGVSAARNAGVDLAKGEYIQFLDADDSLSPGKIAIQIEEMDKNPSLDITYSKVFYYRDKEPGTLYLDFALQNIPWLKEVTCKGHQMIEDMLLTNFSTIHSPLIKKSFIDTFSIRFDESMSHLEDWDFWFKCAINNAYFQYIGDKESFVLVRVHENSASQNDFKLDLGAVYFRNKINEYLNGKLPLNQNERERLRKINRKYQKQPIKYLIFNSLFDLSQLKVIYIQAGFSMFSLCLIKAVSMKLRSSIK